MPADERQPIDSDTLHYLNELRDLARRGQGVPLLGSAFYLLWGGTIAVATALHLFLALEGFDGDLIPWVWAMAMGSTLVCTFVMVARISDDTRAIADRNQSSGFGWRIAGAASVLFFVTGWMARPEAIILAPVVTGYVFAVVMAFSAVISRLRILRLSALGWLAFATVYLALPNSLAQVAAIGIAAILLLILPGVLLRRLERSPAA